MRLAFLFASTLPLVACGLQVSLHPPGGDDDAGTSSSPPPVGSAVPPSDPVEGGSSDCDDCDDAGSDAGFDAGHEAGIDAGRDAGKDAGHDAGHPTGGGSGCPSSCTLESMGVPPCESPLQTCDCPTATPLPSGCSAAPGGGSVLFCCP